MKTSAVLTADIVNSSRLAKPALEQLVRAIRAELGDSDPAVHFYRGDGFNVLVPPGKALATAASLRAIARTYQPPGEDNPIDIRIAIGIGPVEEPVASMAAGKGLAFTLSGRELDAITDDGRRLAIRCYDEKSELGFKALALYADYILSRCSPRQAEVVLELLHGANEKEVALKLRKKQPTVNKLKKAALWDEFEQILELYRDLVLTLQPVK